MGIFENVDNWKYNLFFLFPKNFQEFFWVSKNGIYVKEHLSMNTYAKFQVALLKNDGVLPVLMPKNGHILRY